MKTCPNCQNPVNDGELFCPNCGTRIAVQPNPDIDSKSNAQQPYGEPPFYTEQTNFAQNNNYYTVPQTGWGINTTPYLIWSILNIIFCCLAAFHLVAGSCLQRQQETDLRTGAERYQNRENRLPGGNHRRRDFPTFLCPFEPNYVE